MIRDRLLGIIAVIGMLVIAAVAVWAIHHNEFWASRCRAAGGHVTNTTHLICVSRDGRVLEP